MKLEERIKEILTGYEEIIVAYIYGSTARGTERTGSDLDIGLFLKDDYRPDSLYTARIAGEIEEGCRLKREVDVRMLNDKPVTFLHQVLKYGRVVFTRDEGKRVEFETGVYDRYLDYKPYFDHFNEVRRRRLLA